MRYLFKHILARDAVCDMQSHRRLRELHRRAAGYARETSPNGIQSPACKQKSSS